MVMPSATTVGNAAGVIEVVVRDHAVADRLVRDDLLRLGDDGLRPRLVLRARLEEHDVIGELDGERVVGAVDAPHAVGELLGVGPAAAPPGPSGPPGPPPRPAGGGGGVTSAWMLSGLARMPSVCSSNVGQPPRFCTHLAGYITPLASRYSV